MHDVHWIANLVFLADWIIRIGLSVRVVMRRLPVGVSLAWLAIILIFPFGGAVLYLLLGEYLLGRRRMRHPAAFREPDRTVRSELRAADGVEPATLASGSAALAPTDSDNAAYRSGRLAALYEWPVIRPELLETGLLACQIALHYATLRKPTRRTACKADEAHAIDSTRVPIGGTLA